MITITAGRLRSRNVYFAEKPLPADALGFTAYTACTCISARPFFARTPVHTKIIDLCQDGEAIFGCFNATTQYEVRRATKEGVVSAAEENFDRFFAFHREFARSKPLPYRVDYVTTYQEHLTITKALLEEEILCMHSYLTDRSIGRVTLLTSSSLFRRDGDSQKRNLVGRANRFLHYRDMLMFKEQGYATYDLGGYALATTNGELQAINRFKDGFGGKLREESNYFSYPRLLLNEVKRLLAPVHRGTTAEADG